MPSKKQKQTNIPKRIINKNPSEYSYPFTSIERKKLKTDGSIFLSRDNFTSEINKDKPSGLRVTIPDKSTFFFGQGGVKKSFNNGPYKGKNIKDAALEAYITGSYYSMKFHYVERDVGDNKAVKIAENNRTLTFFSMLGIPPLDPICKTGIISHEKAVDKNSRELEKGYSNTILVREM